MRRPLPTLVTEPSAETLAPPERSELASAREESLASWLAAQPGVVIGFSGGVDSTYLAAVALDVLGPDRTLAVIGRSASLPAKQAVDASDLARRLGLPVLEIATFELDDPRYAANPTNRCFYCKHELWSRLAPFARDRGFALVDGTIADDRADFRPGAAAGDEWEVRSPLAMASLTKRDVRLLSARRGLETADAPSSPCLSSRLPYGTPVTPERLRQVEQAEDALRRLGVSGDLRVRHHGELARIELADDELARWLAPPGASRLRSAVASAGFARVALELNAFRSGSLNVLGGVVPA